MNPVERLERGDDHLSACTRMVGAAILRQVDPLTGRARVTAEQLAAILNIGVGTVRKATDHLTRHKYLEKIRVGRNVEYLPGRTLG